MKKIKKDEQPYKVGKPFVKWLDSQIACYGNWTTRWEYLEDTITQEAYQFIRSIVKP